MPTPEEIKATIAAAHELMEREFARTFPPELIAEWKESQKRLNALCGTPEPVDREAAKQEQQKLNAVLKAARETRKSNEQF